MIEGLQRLPVAAGIDFDSIVPFGFVFLIVVSQILGALKKKSSKVEEDEPDVDALERARQIREEIRRKIEERRQEMEPGTTRPVSRPVASEYNRTAGDSAQPARGGYNIPRYDPTKPDGQPRIPQRPTYQPSQPPIQRKTGPAKPVYTPPVRSGPSLEEQLAEQRKKLEAARQTQMEARARAKRMLEESGFEMRSREKQAWQGRAKSGDFRKQLMGDLRSRKGLKSAILLREILGKPLGIR